MMVVAVTVRHCLRRLLLFVVVVVAVLALLAHPRRTAALPNVDNDDDGDDTNNAVVEYLPVDDNGEPLGAMKDEPHPEDYLYITGKKFYWPAPHVGARMKVRK